MIIETNTYFWDEINGHLCGFTTAGLTTSIGAGTTYLLTHAINIMPIGASIALFLNALRTRCLSAQTNPVTQTQQRWQARLGALSLIYLGTKALLPTLPTLIKAMTFAIGISPVATTAAALALAVILLSLAAMCALYHCGAIDMKDYKCIDTFMALGCGGAFTGLTYAILSVLNTPWISNGLLTVAASTISTAAAATLLPVLALGIGYLTYQLLSPPTHATQEEKREVTGSFGAQNRAISPTLDGDTRPESQQQSLYPHGYQETESDASLMSDRDGGSVQSFTTAIGPRSVISSTCD